MTERGSLQLVGLSERDARQLQLALRDRIVRCLVSAAAPPERRADRVYWEWQASECRAVLVQLEKLFGKMDN